MFIRHSRVYMFIRHQLPILKDYVYSVIHHHRFARNLLLILF